MIVFKIEIGWSSICIGDTVEFNREIIKVLSIISIEIDRDGELIICGTGVPLDILN